ncbi:hypothetical protein [Candidatus Finniella inopinata]|uniref:Sel1 repeat family protein n=1 Tax=Candidatus Finniella inopinata TaxID=1696036 RepID=A0A4Q7DJK7_9PROT|nr:hypothetical protein [Candidatus Finniella inopinata]RZI46518.1 hypothetical protein EQU50_02730 [Candidatus Finniella inopinata]
MAALDRYAPMLFNGTDGIKKDIPKALKMIKEAANVGTGANKQGLTERASELFHNYALMLYQGADGVEKDLLKAVQTIREAASLGNSRSTAIWSDMRRRAMEQDEGLRRYLTPFVIAADIPLN